MSRTALFDERNPVAWPGFSSQTIEDVRNFARYACGCVLTADSVMARDAGGLRYGAFQLITLA
jgi:hypothetical protein